MRWLFEPCLVNDVFGDPALYVDFRDERRAILVDLGDISRLPPRKLLRLTHVFVSHTHMDHFAGLDTLVRVVLGRMAALTLVGGPGFVAQVEHKLAAYSWNVVDRYDVALAIHVREIGTDGRGRCARFSSRRGFAREDGEPFAIEGDVLHDEEAFRVRGRFVDHGMPCLAFAIEEKLRLRVAKDRLAAAGFATGPWLRALKRALASGAPADTPMAIAWRDAAGEHATRRPLGELARLVLDVAPGQRIGYATDLRHTAANVDALVGLFSGVDRLYIESVFLDADADHAARKNHLTARQAGEIARAAGARSVVNFHVSPRYQGREDELAAELQAAWRGLPPAPVPRSDGRP